MCTFKDTCSNVNKAYSCNYINNHEEHPGCYKTPTSDGPVECLVRCKCPFCGSVPYYPTKIKKNKTITGCANNKCPIFGVNMTVKQWESRSI